MDSGRREDWEAYRQRMLSETSRFIEWGLRNPDKVPWIPAKPTDERGFPSGVADWYWGTVLGGTLEGVLQRWRVRLGKARQFLRR
jgi:hypothetical protein